MIQTKYVVYPIIYSIFNGYTYFCLGKFKKKKIITYTHFLVFMYNIFFFFHSLHGDGEFVFFFFFFSSSLLFDLLSYFYIYSFIVLHLVLHSYLKSFTFLNSYFLIPF